MRKGTRYQTSFVDWGLWVNPFIYISSINIYQYIHIFYIYKSTFDTRNLEIRETQPEPSKVSQCGLGYNKYSDENETAVMEAWGIRISIHLCHVYQTFRMALVF